MGIKQGQGKYFAPASVALAAVEGASRAVDSAARGETMDVTFARVVLPAIGGIAGGVVGGLAGGLAGAGTPASLLLGAGGATLGAAAGAAAGEWLADKIANAAALPRPGC